MRKILSVLLAFLMLISLTACGGNGNEESGSELQENTFSETVETTEEETTEQESTFSETVETTEEETTEQESTFSKTVETTEEETAEQESTFSETVETTEDDATEQVITVNLDLRKGFTVLYDTTDAKLKKQVNSLIESVKDLFGYQLKSGDIRSSSNVDRKILIGKGSNLSDATFAKLKNYNDFALDVKENTVILAATNDVSYNYLFDYFLYNVLWDSTNSSKLTHENNIVYSASDMFGKQYTDFHREVAETCESEFMLKLFEDRKLNGGYGINMPYRLYVPFDYTPNKEYPVVLCFHSAGQPGSDNEKPVKDLLPHPFNHEKPVVDDAIIIVPQCPSGLKWVDHDWSKGAYSVDNVPESAPMKTALKILELVRNEFSTDKSRYYTFGLSMGGFGVWDVITRHPELWAAAVPLCGGGDPSKGAKLIDIGIWAFHSVDDYVVPVSGTRDTVNSIKIAGGTKVKYTEYNIGLGHGIGGYTLKNDEVFAWMFEQRKSK